MLLILQTKALATYNFLVTEKRNVVAALIPPKYRSAIGPEPQQQTLFQGNPSDTFAPPDIGQVPESVTELRRIDLDNQPISRKPHGLKK